MQVNKKINMQSKFKIFMPSKNKIRISNTKITTQIKNIDILKNLIAINICQLIFIYMYNYLYKNFENIFRSTIIFL